MANLILRPSELIEGKPWSLQLRYHDCCGPTEYTTLTRVSDEIAREIIHAGACEWLFGEPNWDEEHKKRELERARKLHEEAVKIEVRYGIR
ncbi:hypothetical protein [Beijerinckia mobilis]|uniref:hypothetical protein n=1 Tax=Beijerinckia mobilis TaxID=231434 RepID=UPI000551E332|nr:hypothetical protein [Beijerinckia mobilis]